MIRIRCLTPQLRKQLKKPLGILIQGSPEETMIMVKALVEKERPPKIVTVGDQVSKDLINHDLMPDVLIVDNKIMREAVHPFYPTIEELVVNVENPPGTITDEAWHAIEKAIGESRRTKIIVNGEEDLLTLVAILTAPENSLVFYGQPHEGIVAIRATEETKQKIHGIVEAMKAK